MWKGKKERLQPERKQIPHFIYFHPIGFSFWLCPLSAFLSLGSQVRISGSKEPWTHLSTHWHFSGEDLLPSTNLQWGTQASPVF